MSTVDGKFLKRMWVEETPSGTINGSNTAFTISEVPLENATINLFRDGVRLDYTTDYTLSGTTITMVTAPALGQSLRIQYVQRTGGT